MKKFSSTRFLWLSLAASLTLASTPALARIHHRNGKKSVVTETARAPSIQPLAIIKRSAECYANGAVEGFYKVEERETGRTFNVTIYPTSDNHFTVVTSGPPAPAATWKAIGSKVAADFATGAFDCEYGRLSRPKSDRPTMPMSVPQGTDVT